MGIVCLSVEVGVRTVVFIIISTPTALLLERHSTATASKGSNTKQPPR